MAGYYLLAAGILTVNTLIIAGLKALGVNVLLAKIITEAVLFLVSFFCQRTLIFK
jgi:hypothetical protein